MSGHCADGTERPSHAWEMWDSATKRRMADELLFHGAARAAWVQRYINTGDYRADGGAQR